MAVQAGAGEKGVIYTGGIDGSVKRFDIASNSVSTIGMHSPNIAAISGSEKKVAVSCLAVVGDGLLASAGWDGKFHLWDIRSDASDDDIATIKKKKPVATIDLPGKAFSMDVSPDATKVVIATSGRRNVFVDVANLQQRTSNDENSNPDNDNEASSGGGIARVLLDRESSLKYQTRCIKFLSDGRGIAVGSIEGRVAIEYLDDIGIPSGKKKYAFKCHRINDTIYPVNTISFHPTHGTFATGGADGTVITWDGNNKKKLTTIAKLPTSIACVAFKEDGSEVAMASSYTFEEGERDHPREEIYVRGVLEGETKPKDAR